VLSPALLEPGTDELHKQLLDGNSKRFTEFRRRFHGLDGFTFVSAEPGYRLESGRAYSDPRRIIKNSYITIGYADRLLVKVKIEEMALIGGKYYIIKLD